MTTPPAASGAEAGPPVVPSPEPVPVAVSKNGAALIILVVLAAVGFLYFARPVILPVFLACVGAMALKPVIRWFAVCRVSPALSSALVLSLLVGGLVWGCVQFDQPAMTWINEAPKHLTELRQRIQKILPPGTHFSEAAAAISNLGATEAEKRAQEEQAPTLQIRDNHGAGFFLTWTGSFLAGAGETLILTYLLLASGDLFLQKLVRVMPTLSDKKRAVEISHEIQQNISNYLFSISVINVGLGVGVSIGLYILGVPNAAMWGILVTVLNFIPYFGPVAGVLLLAAVGILTFDNAGQGLLAPAWYLLLHLVEANLVTPVLLGRRFTLNPVIIFVSLIFWTWLWGMPGALLSLPILVTLKAVCDRFPSLAAVSELLIR